MAQRKLGRNVDNNSDVDKMSKEVSSFEKVVLLFLDGYIFCICAAGIFA